MIAVLDYGIGNLRSAQKALEHVGADAALVTDPDHALEADGFVLPGVGAFGRCLEALRASGLDRVVATVVADGRPFIGICVGMQMLYEGSEENPDAVGLGVLPGIVSRLPAGVKHPQMQWNRLIVSEPSPMFPAGGGLAAGGLAAGGLAAGGLADAGEQWMYFVHSFAPPAGPDVVAVCEYGGPVTAAVVRGNVWATQFHPEKSGTAGLALLSRFARTVEQASGVPAQPSAASVDAGPLARTSAVAGAPGAVTGGR
jgi:glutamine amidotransferase